MKVKQQTIRTAFVLAIEFLFVGLVLAIDLLTKHFVYTPLAESNGTNVAINGVLEFHAVENTGASFGLFQGTVLALGIVSLVASIAIAVVIFMTQKLHNPLLNTALVLILGGALGNMVDRLFLGFVRDFIHLPFLDFFGYFNIADNALTIGTVLAVVYLIFGYSADMKKLEDKKAALNGGDTAKPIAANPQSAPQVTDEGENNNANPIDPSDATAKSKDNLKNE